MAKTKYGTVRKSHQLAGNILKHFRDKVEPELKRAFEQAVDEGGHLSQEIYDSAVAVYGNDAMMTKMQGHPISGNDLVNQCYKQEGNISSDKLVYNLWSTSALDAVTGDAYNQPYWALLNWGTGTGFKGSRAIAVLGMRRPAAPTSILSRTYPTKYGGSSSPQKQGFGGRWWWIPKTGFGNKGQGTIVPTYMYENWLNVQNSKPGSWSDVAKSSGEEVREFDASHFVEKGAQHIVKRLIDIRDNGLGVE